MALSRLVMFLYLNLSPLVQPLLRTYASMSHQLTEKIGDLLTQEGLLTAEQLAKGIAIQKQQVSTEPIGKLCVSLGFVTSTDLEKVLVKHR